ncbi:SdpI family protein [Clostridium oceanicum]|uniref:SdpI family protein n=1 Tax=Clostridium oceanicum TaxID=1543 RepID=A0ABP3UML0_9CLOT
MNKNYNKIDLIIFIFSLAILGLGFIAPHSNIVIGSIGILVYGSLILLHVYTPNIANLSIGNPKIKTMKRINIFSIVLLAICFTVLQWSQELSFVEKNQSLIGFVIAIAVILVIGNVAPKIPFNRYMGLRLPWTIRDESTWKVAHRLLGYLTFPIVIVMLVGGLMVDINQFAKWGIISWVVIPSAYSYFYYTRMQKKSKI